MRKGKGDLRAARFRPRVRAARAAAALLCFALIVAGGWAAQRRIVDLMALVRNGRATDAQIFNMDHLRDLGDASSGQIYYAFRVSETRVVTGRYEASRETLQHLRIGRRLHVVYLPSHPNVYILGHLDPRVYAQNEALGVVGLFSFGALALLLPLLLLDNAMRRQLQLARQGVLMTGEITGCRPVSRWIGAFGFRVRYTLPLPSGDVAAGQALFPRHSGEPTLVGFPITLLCNPRRPQEHRPRASFFWIKFV